MKLSIVIPVYNSSKIIDELTDRIIISIAHLNLSNSFELILINDFSSDNSWEKILYLGKKYPFIKGFNLDDNYGQHNAIMAGLNNTEGDFIITMDDDLQHAPEFFSEILDKLIKYDVCYTNYKNRKHSFWKKIVSIINNLVSSFLLNKPFKIYMSSFRGIKKNIVKEIIKFKDPDVYLDGLILKATKRIGMIEVDHFARRIGESNYTLKKLFLLWSNMVLNFSFLPLRPVSIFGYIIKVIIKFLRKPNNKSQYKISAKT